MKINFKILFFIILLFIIPVMFANKKKKNKKELFSITGDKMQIRPCDPAGCGYFGATRTNHTHKGSDVVIVPNSPIYAPVGGTVRKLFVYRNSTKMTGVEISNNDVKIKLFYVDASHLYNGQTVKAGDVVGYAQNVAAYYNNSSMTPHIHVEVRIKGKLINPEEYFKKLID